MTRSLLTWESNPSASGRTCSNQLFFFFFFDVPEAKRSRKKKLTDRIPQYKILIRTSMGVTHTDKVFLSRNNRLDCVRSAKEPTRNVVVAMDRPIMVRY